MRVSGERMFRSHFLGAFSAQEQGEHVVYACPGELAWAGRGDTNAQAWADACKRHGITAVKESTPC